MNREGGERRVRRTLYVPTLLVLALAGAAALGTAGSGSAATLHGTRSASAPCGVLPTVPPKDPQKALTGVSAAIKSQYNGWPFQLHRSSLASWKPKGKGPYTVGIVIDGLTNPFNAELYTRLQALFKGSKAVKKVIATASTAGNVTSQVQAYQSMVQKGANLIVLQPTSGPALLPLVKKALKQGIATVAVINPLSDASAVSIAPNVYTSAGGSLANLLKIKGGKGNYLAVHGIRVTPVDQSTFAVFKSILANCPDAKTVGELDGNFAPPDTRAAVLQFLSTYPGNIDGVYQTATMGPSIIGAFQQAGRSVPSVMAASAQKGDLGYWQQNSQGGYKTSGFAGDPDALCDLVRAVAVRMLAGQGPKVSDIPWEQPQITAANLSVYAQSGWTIDTPGNAPQPKSTEYTSAQLGSLFTHPTLKVAGS
jgi:ribose transport system substrate-binding protein